MDGDLDGSLPLTVAFDANSNINCVCVGQPKDGKLRVLKSFYVKTPGKLQDLVKQIADYYRPKLRHDMVVYYDHTFTWETGASNESYADIIRRVLEENGYTVQMVYVGPAPRHDWKHLNIDRTLKGDPEFLPVRIALLHSF